MAAKPGNAVSVTLVEIELVREFVYHHIDVRAQSGCAVFPRKNQRPAFPCLARRLFHIFMHHPAFVDIGTGNEETTGVDDDFRPTFVDIRFQVQNRQRSLYGDGQLDFVCDGQAVRTAEALAGEQPCHPAEQRFFVFSRQPAQKMVLRQRGRPMVRVNGLELPNHTRLPRPFSQQPSQHNALASTRRRQTGQATAASAAKGPASRMASICSCARTYSTPANDKAFSETSAKCSLL